MVTTKLLFGAASAPSIPDTPSAPKVEPATQIDTVAPTTAVLTEADASKVIARWDPKWPLALPTRSPEEIDALTTRANAAIGEIQKFANARPGTSHCPVVRAFHSKGYLDETKTPINDGSRDWDSPWITVGVLEFPQQDKSSAALASKTQALVSKALAFTPFNEWDGDVLEPLGDINMMRKSAYAASAQATGRTGASARGCPFGHG